MTAAANGDRRLPFFRASAPDIQPLCLALRVLQPLLRKTVVSRLDLLQRIRDRAEQAQGKL